jgi:hypothetical protein
LLLSQQPSVWSNAFTSTATENEEGIPHSYTALGMAPFVVANGLLNLGIEPRLLLFGFLALLAIAVLVPAIWASARLPATLREGAGILLPIALIGVLTQPFLMTLDRGNSVGFAVPFLLLFALFLNRNPQWVAPVAVVLAAGVRPQFAALALGFLAFGRWWAFLWSLVAVLVTNVLAFAFWPGGWGSNLQAWFTNVTQYQSSSPLTNNFPANLSTAHAMTVPARWLERLPEPLATMGRSLSDSIVAQPAWPGILLAIVSIAVFILARTTIPRLVVVVTVLALPTLVPSLSYGYYSLFALVIAAIVITGRDGFAEAPNGLSAFGIYQWMVLITVALTLIPLPFVLAEGESSAILQNIGLLWTAVVGYGLVIALVQHFRSRSVNPSKEVSVH